MATRRLTGTVWTALDDYSDPSPDDAVTEWRTPAEAHDPEPGSPVWVPGDWPTTHEPELYRVLSCSRYRACTDVAIGRRWAGWGCHGCDHVPEGRPVLEPPPERRTVCIRCRRVMPSTRGCRAITCSQECAREHRLASNARRQRERRACQNRQDVGE